VKFQILIIIVLIALSFGCTEKNNNTITYTNYSDNQVSLSYPSHWKAQNYNGIQTFYEHAGFLESILSEDEIVEGLGIENSLVTPAMENTSNLTLDELEQREKSSICKGDMVISSERIDFVSMNAVKIHVIEVLKYKRDCLSVNSKEEVDKQKPNAKLTIINVKKEGITYRISYWIEIGKEDEYQPIMDKILSSIVIK